jgi:gluconolactonase
MQITPFLVTLAVVFLQDAPDSSSVIESGAKMEKVWGEGTFTEGGALDQDGTILFSDIGNRILRFDPRSGRTTVFREPSGRANGLIFDKLGRLIVAEGANHGGGRRVSITARDGTIRTLADNYDNKKFNSPNDLAVDRDGHVYVSDPRYVGTEPRELDSEGVYLIGLQGDVIPLLTTAFKPNGLALSPDEKTLYISDNGARRRALIAADRGAMGKVKNARVIHEFGEGRGIDGMTVTTDGRIVAASALDGKPAVIVLSKEGKILAGIAVPEAPANVEFGGDDRKTLYICAGKSLYRIKTTMTGHNLWPPLKRS